MSSCRESTSSLKFTSGQNLLERELVCVGATFYYIKKVFKDMELWAFEKEVDNVDFFFIVKFSF